MGKTLTEKLIAAHLVSGSMEPGAEVALRIDQTLTQDATGTMAYLEFESMGIDRVKTKRSVAYIDHNTLQSGFENADDHRYIQTVAAKHGIWFSRPGNGICHQVHLERFGVPGQTLIGSDSHTPTAGGIGMLAFGINSGAYVAEIIRAGIESIPKGQMEAGRSLGLNYVQTMRVIILPQAVKNILPALGNELIVMVKETSVISVIAVNDLMKMAQYIGSRTWDTITPLVIAGIIYLLITILLTKLQGMLERRLSQGDRH